MKVYGIWASGSGWAAWYLKADSEPIWSFSRGLLQVRINDPGFAQRGVSYQIAAFNDDGTPDLSEPPAIVELDALAEAIVAPGLVDGDSDIHEPRGIRPGGVDIA